MLLDVHLCASFLEVEFCIVGTEMTVVQFFAYCSLCNSSSWCFQVILQFFLNDCWLLLPFLIVSTLCNLVWHTCLVMIICDSMYFPPAYYQTNSTDRDFWGLCYGFVALLIQVLFNNAASENARKLLHLTSLHNCYSLCEILLVSMYVNLKWIYALKVH